MSPTTVLGLSTRSPLGLVTHGGSNALINGACRLLLREEPEKHYRSWREFLGVG